jgi:acylphosphatase
MSKAKLRIKGRVQGVFYRQKTREKAQMLRLAGWVRNVPDGSVEAEVCGAREKVEILVAWCKKGPALARVESVEIDWIDHENDDSEAAALFEIR